ncbi:MAG: transcriptional regulator [Methanobrevibacter sp.]|uniref:transcriptional regulator n=1 Tax=uncultured Methanobrevibacter sp. TaxID=253161 RepID=UPI0025F9F0F9|nr:transcriptional regulator [uncultured Methanobrevibacter sp.]MEE1129456.1 transcriptional regulator [Methanobrevibacter sp.]
MDDDTLKLISHINISTYRLKTVKALDDGEKTPTQISKFTGIRLNHISGVLKHLKDLNIVICINEEKRRNRIYKLTSLGQSIVDYLE